MIIQDIMMVIGEIRFQDWSFHVGVGEKNGFYLQARFESWDPFKKQKVPCTSRKWMLSEHMVKSEIVQTVLKCVLTALEHEAREAFTYKGRVIFGPHYDVDALVALCDTVPLDYRRPV